MLFGRIADRAEMLLWDAAMNRNATVVILLRQHLGMRGQERQQAAVAGFGLDVDVQKAAAQGFAGAAGQLRKARAYARADRKRVRIAPSRPSSGAIRKRVDLVKHQQRVLFLDAEFSSTP